MNSDADSAAERERDGDYGTDERGRQHAGREAEQNRVVAQAHTDLVNKHEQLE